MTSSNISLVSIITPVYNAEAYLAIAIDSVLGQSYKNFELILVNDGSVDNSYNIITSYQQVDSRIKLININGNKGVANARNEGLKYASGEYICWIDSDDIYHPDFIKIMVSTARDNNCDIVECKTLNFAFNKQPSFNNVVALSKPIIEVGGGYNTQIFNRKASNLAVV